MNYQIYQTEQVSVCLRYVTCDYTVKEMFMDFIEVERITGKEAILQHLSEWGLCLGDLRG